MNIDVTLEQRRQTHGRFPQQAQVSQELKLQMSFARNWKRLTPYQREALEMIQHKIARILSGDPNHADSWHDIAGYATLAVRELGNTTE